MTPADNRRIAITGEGIVSAIGLNKDEVLNSLLSNKSGIGEMTYLKSKHSHLPVGEVKISNAEMASRLKVNADDYNRTALMGIMAISEALTDAGIDTDREENTDREPAVLISGTTVGGMDVTEVNFPDILNTRRWHKCLASHDCGTSTDLMSRYFGIFTDDSTISTACSSAANAIMLGAKLLMTGQADIVVAGGSEALSMFHLNGFNSLMILDSARCRPFDRDRRGLNLGEGAAFVVMETEQHARRRGAEIHAYLTGFGNACDAFHQTATSDEGTGAQLAIRKALDTAGLKPSQIDYINVHGTGTPDNDRSETRALQSIFGDNVPPLSSTKSFTGHTTSASGSIEAVICLLAMRHNFIPANLGWENSLDNGIAPSTGATGVDLRNVLCDSFGFGGNDSSLVFSKAEAPRDIRFNLNPSLKIVKLSEVEVNDDEQLAEVKRFVKPMELRRMGKLMRAALLASMKALEEAGISTPDAIITGTSLGCLENSEKFLIQMHEQQEGLLQPTYFMQSTHNTLGSQIAIRTKCHGYNITFTQGDRSMEWALRDAETLLRSGEAKTVLVGCYDEGTPLFNEVSNREPMHTFNAKAIVLTCGEEC